MYGILRIHAMKFLLSINNQTAHFKRKKKNVETRLTRILGNDVAIHLLLPEIMLKLIVKFLPYIILK